MFFQDLRDTLLEAVRTRVRNGELTERGLARLLGVSQPHMHNVLKGCRSMSVELCDRFLAQLRMSALDLADPKAVQRYLTSERPDSSLYSYLPVLEGRVGPAHPWPTAVESHERFPVPLSVVSKMWHPVVARASDDVRMHPLFGDGDTMLLDQSHKARTQVDPQAFYVLKRGRVGLIRRLRMSGRALYMVTEDDVGKPENWERLPVEGQSITHFVRARAVFLAREVEWQSR